MFYSYYLSKISYYIKPEAASETFSYIYIYKFYYASFHLNRDLHAISEHHCMIKRHQISKQALFIVYRIVKLVYRFVIGLSYFTNLKQ